MCCTLSPLHPVASALVSLLDALCASLKAPRYNNADTCICSSTYYN